MTNIIRRQLTLFVDPQEAEPFEQVRLQFNPKQYEIIKAHVTLCREDEIENLEKVKSNLLVLTQPEIVIDFTHLERFYNCKGLFLTAKKNNHEFDDLRNQILNGIINHPRKQEAHITLMHPRNSTCTDIIFSHIKKINLPTKLTFKKISLIEQKDGSKWEILEEFNLAKNKRN